jgi:hypothetical protein
MCAGHAPCCKGRLQTLTPVCRVYVHCHADMHHAHTLVHLSASTPAAAVQTGLALRAPLSGRVLASWLASWWPSAWLSWPPSATSTSSAAEHGGQGRALQQCLLEDCHTVFLFLSWDDALVTIGRACTAQSCALECYPWQPLWQMDGHVPVRAGTKQTISNVAHVCSDHHMRLSVY